jgi:hypothetical protein
LFEKASIRKAFLKGFSFKIICSKGCYSKDFFGRHLQKAFVRKAPLNGLF